MIKTVCQLLLVYGLIKLIHQFHEGLRPFMSVKENQHVHQKPGFFPYLLAVCISYQLALFPLQSWKFHWCNTICQFAWPGIIISPINMVWQLLLVYGLIKMIHPFYIGLNPTYVPGIIFYLLKSWLFPISPSCLHILSTDTFSMLFLKISII